MNTNSHATTVQQHRQLVADTMRASAWHLEALEIVRELGLADWAIGAGFVRNAVWDRLHGFAVMTPLNDIDVLYFDPSNLSIERDIHIEEVLFAAHPDRPGSVHNQARMHFRNNDEPYRSTADAISFWLETATGVAVSLDDAGDLTVIAPFGLTDLIGMQSRPTEAGLIRLDQYRDRMISKDWPGTWPQVTVLGGS